MRPIDADKIKIPDTHVDPFENCRNCELLDKYQVQEIIDSAPTIEVPKWIPCSERLPKEKGEYLVTYHPCYWDMVEPEVKVGIDTFRGKTSWAKKKYQKVIAWKPLPMAWEGEEDEADKSQSE